MTVDESSVAQRRRLSEPGASSPLVPAPDESTTLLSKPAGQPPLYSTIRRRSQGEVFLTENEATISGNGGVNDDTEANDAAAQPSSPWGTLSILLLGVFVSQLDQSIVLATYGKIASEFQELDSGSWLMSAYILAQCAVQPLYGKLSDIYSRKSCLLTAYTLFAIGTAGIGLSQTMSEVIAWRAVQGTGGSGMVSVVSIIIADIIPKREIATMRSYVNVLQTMGRSCGGVVGGLLTQAVGWRWAFLVQVPPTLAAIAMVAFALRLSAPASTRGAEVESQWTKLKRVDFIGAFFLLTTILSACLVLELGGQRLPWNSPWIFGIVGGALLSGSTFVLTAKFVQEPIFPLRLLSKLNTVANYAVILLSVTAQMSLMTAVPIYFQATAHASTAAAGAYLIPAFAGNTMGGLLAGYWIKSTGRYKTVTVLGPVMSFVCMVLILFTWNGMGSPVASLLIFPGGFAMGAVYASAFVGLVSAVAEEDVAVVASGMYLFFNIGAIAGVSVGSAASQTMMRSALQTSLSTFPNKDEIIKHAISDLEYIWKVRDEDLRQILIEAYVRGFHAVNWLGIGCSTVAFVFALASNGTRLDRGG